MARIRTIKPEFWTSEQVTECSVSARLLFIGIWNFCDDAGRMNASPKQIKALVLPADDFDAESVRRMIDELERNGLIIRYVVDGKEFLQVTGWHHQRIDRAQKSKIPPPPDNHSSNDRRTIDVGREGKGEEGRGVRDNPDSTAAVGCARVHSPEIQIRAEIMEIHGLNPPIRDIGRVGVWLAQGYSEALIRAVVIEALRERRDGKRIGSLAFFDERLAEAAAVKAPPVAPSADPKRPLPISQAQFPGDSVVDIVNPGKVAASILAPKVREFYRSGVWPEVGFGKAPGSMGCYIPPSFLAWCGGPAIAEEVA